MKRKMKSWISLLLCLMMVLQSVTAVAAEPEEDLQQPLTKTELTLMVKDTEHGTVTVIEKVKQADERYYFQPEEEVKVQITPEKGYELAKLVMKGLDTQKELLPETKDGYYLWKAEENMELEATFVEMPKEPEASPEEPEVKPEEPEVKPEEPEVKPEEPEEEPETEATPEEPEVTPEKVTPTDDPMGELLSIQPKDLAGQGLRMAARANTITYLGKVSYGGTAVGHFLVNGKIAFCMEHQKETPPTGTSFSESIYNNATIRKVLYYGWGGIEPWSGFGSEAQGIVCTSLVLSYYYSGPDSIIILGGPTDKTIGVSAFMNYIQSKLDVGSAELALSKTYTESFLSTDKTYQRTDSIKLSSDSRNTITIPLQKGVTLVNETTGAVGTGNVTVKGGDTFYLKAPLSLNGTWKSGKLYGSMGKFQSVLMLTNTSGMQNLGQGRYGGTDPDKFVELTVKWVQMGDIKITKFLEGKDEIKVPAAGAEFTLIHKETGEKVVIKANADGVATTEDRKNYPIGRLIGGVWTVTETKTPAGFKPIDPFEVTISGQGQVFSFIAEDKEIKAALQVVKVDESTGQIIKASGATFKIVDEKGKDVEFVDYSPHKVTFTEFTTDENGQFTLPQALKHGDYELVEVKAPEGYLLCDPIPFTVDEYADFEKPLIVKAEDKNIMGKIQLRKIDVETQEPVAGAVYQIYAKEDIVTGDGTVRANAGDLVGTMTTDAQGIALSEELFLGTYLVKEYDAPDGYELDPTEYEVTLAYKDQNTEIVTEELEVTDQPTTVTVIKKALGKDENLKGVKFQIWNEQMDSEIDGGMGMKETYTTDEDGKITVKYLAPGTYCMQEVETIPGYILDETIRKFEVDENGVVIGGGQITVENDFTKVKISKQDITNGKELPGAELEVRKEDGTVVEAWTSTDKPHLIEALPEGDYVLRETMAPKGYQVAQDIHFTVKSTGEIQHVVMKDELKEGTIRTNLPDNFRDGSGTNGGIKTGDHAPMGILLAGMGIALAGIVSVIFWKRKKEALDEEA